MRNSVRNSGRLRWSPNEVHDHACAVATLIVSTFDTLQSIKSRYYCYCPITFILSAFDTFMSRCPIQKLLENILADASLAPRQLNYERRFCIWFPVDNFDFDLALLNIYSVLISIINVDWGLRVPFERSTFPDLYLLTPITRLPMKGRSP